MTRLTQDTASLGRRFCVGFALAAVATLAGCGTPGFSIADAVPDRTLITGAIAGPPLATQNDPTAASDEETIRNAVSSAIVEEVRGNEAGGELGWANASTGSRGSIRQLSEQRDGLRLCRRFTASRESFEGVHLYRGETCLGSAGMWTMTAFARVE